MNNIQKKTKLKTMRLNTEVIEKVEQMAREQNRNFTNMVETILMQAVDKKG